MPPATPKTGVRVHDAGGYIGIWAGLASSPFGYAPGKLNIGVVSCLIPIPSAINIKAFCAPNPSINGTIHSHTHSASRPTCGPVFIWQAIALCPLRPPSFAPLLHCMAPEEGHTTQDVPISAPSILPPSIPPPDTVPDTSTEPGVAAVDRDIAIHGAQFFSEDPVSRDIAYHCAQFFFEDPAAAYARCRQYLSNHRPVCQYTSNHPQYPSAPAIEKALYLEGWGITDKVSREMGPGARRDPLEGSRIPHSQEKDKPA
ncbi:hypothetical protein B0H13DRAFT_1898179 [Mycena leptocephala]|nr:hypothetical protein B0H13DRAFT_1898179 [Mycena leptocephala]